MIGQTARKKKQINKSQIKDKERKSSMYSKTRKMV
jgi:hypothetical protein